MPQFFSEQRDFALSGTPNAAASEPRVLIDIPDRDSAFQSERLVACENFLLLFRPFSLSEEFAVVKEGHCAIDRVDFRFLRFVAALESLDAFFAARFEEGEVLDGEVGEAVAKIADGIDRSERMHDRGRGEGADHEGEEVAVADHAENSGVRVFRESGG